MHTTHLRPRPRASTTLGLLLAAGLVACSDVPEDATRSGGIPPALVLTMGTDDPEGRPAAQQIAEFARHVSDVSAGSVRIEPRYRAAGEGVDDWDQAVAGLVVDGELDLGMIPARAWDTEGVDTLRALHAPLLVTSDGHMDAVASDEDLAADLMAGLDVTGVRGLALVPEGIRHLITFDDDPNVVQRLSAGGAVRSPRSETTWAFFDALGARPSDADLSEDFVAAESELALFETLGAADGVVGNLPLFPKLNALVVNADTFGGLSDQQQGWLRQAAAATRDWAIDSREDDTALAATHCEQGGTVLHVPEADAAAVREVAGDVGDELRRDEVTAGLMDRIAALDPGGLTTLPECLPGGDPADALTPDGGALPDGVYRVAFTDRYLRDQGLTAEEIGYNHGVWTISLRDGKWSVDQVAADLQDQFEGVYGVRGDQLSWQFYAGEPVSRLRWRVSEDGDLTFSDLGGVVEDARFHFGLPWQRVGDLEPAVPEVTADTIRPDGGDLPDGTYRARFTDEYLAGSFMFGRGLTPEEVQSNHGVWTFVLDDGRWTFDQVAPDITDHGEGIYQVRDREIWWRLDDQSALIHAQWTVSDDGDLSFEELPATDTPDFQFDLTWERVD